MVTTEHPTPITQDSTMGKRERVRTISQREQETLERAPAFGYFCAWLYRLAQAALAKQETTPPPEEAA